MYEISIGNFQQTPFKIDIWKKNHNNIMIAGTNPLEVHCDIFYERLGSHFENESRRQARNPKICCTIEKQQNDNRIHKFANYAFMISPGNELDFFRSMAKTLIEYRELVEKYKEEDEKRKDKNYKKPESYANYFEQCMKNSKSCEYLSTFLGIYNHCETASLLVKVFTDIFQSFGNNGIHAINQFFIRICPYAAFIACLGALIWSRRMERLDEERRENHLTFINNFFNIVTSKRGYDEIMRSNIFIYSIDKRDSTFSENHGSFCGFYHVRELEKFGAPIGQKFGGKCLIGVYSEIYTRIFHEDQLDFEKLKNFLDGTILYRNEISLHYEEEENDSSGCNIS